MREVSCKATRPLLAAIEGDVDLNELVAGLPVTLAELRDTSNRISWDVFVELLARVDDRGGPVEEIGARIATAPSFELLWRGGQLFFSAKQLYDVGVRFVAPALFPVAMTAEWLPSGRVIFEGEILPGYRESIHFVRICIGNIVATPRALNLPASQIVEQSFDPCRVRLVLLPPPSHTILSRVKRSAGAFAALGQVLRGIEAHENELWENRAALARSRNEMKQLIERLPDGVLLHRAGIVRWVNSAMVEILGLKQPEDVIGRSRQRVADGRFVVALLVVAALIIGALRWRRNAPRPAAGPSDATPWARAAGEPLAVVPGCSEASIRPTAVRVEAAPGGGAGSGHR